MSLNASKTESEYHYKTLLRQSYRHSLILVKRASWFHNDAAKRFRCLSEFMGRGSVSLGEDAVNDTLMRPAATACNMSSTRVRTPCLSKRGPMNTPMSVWLDCIGDHRSTVRLPAAA